MDLAAPKDEAFSVPDLAHSPSYSPANSPQINHELAPVPETSPNSHAHHGVNHNQPTTSGVPSPRQHTPPPSTTSPHQSSTHEPTDNQSPTPPTHPTTTTATMPTPAPPFDVPKPWQTAMSMVSINAGLFPQQILQLYQRQQPLQAALHPGHTELDVWRSRRARDRGIKAVQLRYRANDPTRIYLMVIFVDEIDPHTKRPVVRLVTNTSVRHVLQEPCANCPLWLRVVCSGEGAAARQQHDHPHRAGPTTVSPYQIIPCCDGWADSLDFEAPISDEEKQVPAVVDRLIEALQNKNALLQAKLSELEAKEEQITRLRLRATSEMHIDTDSVAAASVAAAGQSPSQPFPPEMAAMMQYWWAAAAVIAFLLVISFR